MGIQQQDPEVSARPFKEDIADQDIKVTHTTMDSSCSASFYMFLKSSDSIAYHKHNHCSEFTVHLPKRLSLSGEWMVGLTEVHFPKPIDQTGQSGSKEDTVLILSPLCDASIVAGTTMPVLGRLHNSELGKTVRFDRVTYMKVKVVEMGEVTIYIRDEKGEVPSFPAGQTWCTLHFVKK